MSSESNRPPGTPGPQPFGPPLGSADWFAAPPPPLQRSRDSRPADAPPRIVRRSPEAPEWAIDPDAIQLALGTPTRTSRRPGARRRWIVGSAVVAALAVVGAGTTVAVVSATREKSGTPAAAPLSAVPAPVTSSVSATSPAAIAPQIPQCRAEAHDGRTVGNGPGGTADGPGAILGFEYSYYTERSGARAQAFIAPDTVNVAAAAGLQEAIDTAIPVGTAYCVRIAAREAELFDVDIEEYRPGGATTVYHQSVRTVVRDGRTLLYEIRDRQG
ncbi:hypothetical protein [Nocardia spumae]|uniref:hypothetical protein n=1 Tax=Nocardia spumae TaxID=2887190 RepID=UPI001D13D3A2|nr:hypothetical protein [Nocardia spumae]